jgi:hypothetical protein
MVAIRVLAVAALVALDVSAAAAQPTRHFHDSWFWGAKGGAMYYQVQSASGGSAIAPIAGADWMITRKRGGIYVAADYAVFDGFVFVNDSINPIDVTPGGRQTDLSDMFRISFAGLLYPLESQRFSPYFGFGIALSSIVSAEAQGTYTSRTQENLVLQTIQDFKTSVAPNLIVGAQLRLPLASVFAQTVLARSHNNFFLYTGPGWRLTGEAGIRYNIGSSIDRLR